MWFFATWLRRHTPLPPAISVLSLPLLPLAQLMSMRILYQVDLPSSLDESFAGLQRWLAPLLLVLVVAIAHVCRAAVRRAQPLGAFVCLSGAALCASADRPTCLALHESIEYPIGLLGLAHVLAACGYSLLAYSAQRPKDEQEMELVASSATLPFERRKSMAARGIPEDESTTATATGAAAASERRRSSVKSPLQAERKERYNQRRRSSVAQRAKLDAKAAAPLSPRAERADAAERDEVHHRPEELAAEAARRRSLAVLGGSDAAQAAHLAQLDQLAEYARGLHEAEAEGEGEEEYDEEDYGEEGAEEEWQDVTAHRSGISPSTSAKFRGRGGATTAARPAANKSVTPPRNSGASPRTSANLEPLVEAPEEDAPPPSTPMG